MSTSGIVTPDKPASVAAQEAKAAPPEQSNPRVRTVQGLRIEKLAHGSGVRFEAVDRFDPVRHVVFRNGSEHVLETRRPDVVHWEAVLDPAGDIARLLLCMTTWPFDARPPSPIHDELEQVIKAGFIASAGYLSAQAKLKPRPTLPGFNLGAVVVARGVKQVADCAIQDDAIRELLVKHATGDHGVLGTSSGVLLDDDKRWVPPLFGPPTSNAVAIEAGRGQVRSQYAIMGGPRKEESISILSDIGVRTLVYSSRDS